MAKMEWQEKINLDKLDEGTRDYMLALLLENRELREAAEQEHESWLYWYKRCEEPEDRASGIGKKVEECKDAFPTPSFEELLHEYKEGGEL